MTTYASIAEMELSHGPRLIETLADRDRDGKIDTWAIERAISDSSAEAETYLATRYNVPLDPVPPALRALVVAMVVYRLANNGAGLTDDIRRRYDDALRQLRDIAGGRANLPGVEPRDDSSDVSPIISSLRIEEVSR